MTDPALLEQWHARRRRITAGIFVFTMFASVTCAFFDLSVRVGGGFYFAAGVACSSLIWMSRG